MKKIISVSAIAAVVLLTGCWEGSSSGVSAPDFATKMAKVESTDDVVKALNEEGPLFELKPTNKLNIKLNIKDTKLPKELSFVTEYVENDIEDLMLNAKRNNCAYYKFENDYKCDKGSYKEIDVIKKVGDQCVIDQKIIGDKCNIVHKDKDGKIRNTQYFNGLYEENLKLPLNEDGSIPNEKVGTWKGIMNFVVDHTNYNENEEKYLEFKGNANLEIVSNKGYKEFNETYISNNTFERKVKGTLNFQIFVDNYLIEDFSSKMNWDNKEEGVDTNYTKTLNGWYDIVFKKAGNGGQMSSKARKGVAAKNFVIKYEVNNTNFSKTTYSGKIGNSCIGGLVDFTTKVAVERNESEDWNVLPYAGQLNLKGAGNTEALVTYKYEDNNKSKSYVEINTTKGNKVYHDRGSMYNDARRYCPQFLEGLNNGFLSWLWKLLYMLDTNGGGR